MNRSLLTALANVSATGFATAADPSVPDGARTTQVQTVQDYRANEAARTGARTPATRVGASVLVGSDTRGVPVPGSDRF